MSLPGASRQQLERALTTAYGDGLLSDQTFSRRLDLLLGGGLIDPRGLIGDLTIRSASPRLAKLRSVLWRRTRSRSQTMILALDWTGGQDELLVGRHHRCDVVLSSPKVSRLHARLYFRDGRWILRDLDSTNGTIVNGASVGRCELRPGDQLVIGSHRLKVD